MIWCCFCSLKRNKFLHRLSQDWSLTVTWITLIHNLHLSPCSLLLTIRKCFICWFTWFMQIFEMPPQTNFFICGAIHLERKMFANKSLLFVKLQESNWENRSVRVWRVWVRESAPHVARRLCVKLARDILLFIFWWLKFIAITPFKSFARSLFWDKDEKICV